MAVILPCHHCLHQTRGDSNETIEFLARRRVSYSVGFTLPEHTPQIYDTIPETAWTPAYNADGQPRDGADVAEITALLDLAAWPQGMRVSRANKIRRRNIQLSNHVLEVTMHLIDIGLRCLVLTCSLSSDLITMFIHARLETHLAAVLPLIPRPHIR